MKTKSCILSAVLLIAGAWAGDLLAQEHLNALIKKCETMDKVNIEVLSNKNRKTKKLEKEVITIRFSQKENPNLLNEFVKAFQQDKEAAYKVIDSKVNGKVIPTYYRFAVGTSDITYSIDDLDKKFNGNSYMLRNGEIQVTKIEKFDFKEESEWG